MTKVLKIKSNIKKIKRRFNSFPSFLTDLLTLQARSPLSTAFPYGHTPSQVLIIEKNCKDRSPKLNLSFSDVYQALSISSMEDFVFC